MSKEMEKKWQDKWEKSKLFQADHDERKKIFLTVAYPYPSGAMHIGHGRTYTVPDVYARFKRMQGYNVLFPMGWHVTGAPVIGIASRIKDKDPWTLELYEKVHKVPKTEIPKLEDPEYIVKYFSTEYHNVMNDMGYSIDWRREFRTTDPTYKKFIEWQIRKLKEMDLIRKGNHPVKYCPHCDNPVGDHDLLEGEGVGVNELTLLKFKLLDKNDNEINGIDEGNNNVKYLVPATFRPETIYGSTNLWLNPDIEYIEVISDASKDGTNGETWIISKEAYDNISNQIKDLKIIGTIDPKPLIGTYVENPVTKEPHPLLPASFVDPEYGSGSVFSVPGHAPADYIALQDLKNNNELLEEYGLEDIVNKIEPLNVVTLKKYSKIPARDVIERLNVKTQEDPNLEEATNELYKVEHSKGIISDHIPIYSGERVSIARENIKKDMISKNQATIMYDFAEHPVICRCGTKCVVKIMDNQWFLKYSDEEWKEKTRNLLRNENIIPNEVRSNLEYYIGWLEDWACSRRIGLGTKLPWDKQWLIEPLTDSTIYMSYYTIAKYLKDINPNDLNDAFFEKVFFDNDINIDNDINTNKINTSQLDSIGADIDDFKLKIDEDIISEIQNEFSYWYPLDWRLSAKDLVGNHLSFHMFHHAALFPPENWPQGMVVFGMGLLEGNKMSSSKGNVILLSDAIEEYGADVVRLFLMSSAEPWQDFDWREKEVVGTKRRLDWFFEFAEKIESIKKSPLDLSNIERVDLTRKIDLWMMNQLFIRINDATNALEGFQTRKALQDSLFLLKKDVDHYMYRTKHLLEDPDEAIIFVLSSILEAWIRILAPFTPHSSEELWSKYGGEGFVSEAEWPITYQYFPMKCTPTLNLQADSCIPSEVIEKSEEMVQSIVKDINEIKKIVDVVPKKIHVYLAPDWKWLLYRIAADIGKPDIGQIMGRAIGENIHDNKKEIADVAKKVGREITKTRYIGKIDEYDVFSDALDFISEEVDAEVIIHTDDSYDPQNKAKNAMPYKPAIFME
ncbi:MAG: leucine--tRNA ligase [Methanobrevibacter arboriphilus]|uniref:Leucine--tRNA ligase n=1 Tax=Methanobrevibacter arboriphilus TaxID=39441 RepID=A0A843ABM6_METAZ|nr:leucine--tRNA ligase [Methanobrevibacter arboriphilus]MBF4468342.1 leucine--tRNA ligase [Methanobrevibacter arboriphilus]